MRSIRIKAWHKVRSHHLGRSCSRVQVNLIRPNYPDSQVYQDQSTAQAAYTSNPQTQDTVVGTDTGLPGNGYSQFATDPRPAYGQHATVPGKTYGQHVAYPSPAYGQNPVRPGQTYGQHPAPPYQAYGQHTAPPYQAYNQQATYPGQTYYEQYVTVQQQESGSGAAVSHSLRVEMCSFSLV